MNHPEPVISVEKIVLNGDKALCTVFVHFSDEHCPDGKRSPGLELTFQTLWSGKSVEQVRQEGIQQARACIQVEAMHQALLSS